MSDHTPTGPVPVTLPAPSAAAAQFALDPTVCYLNHGSFGACPKRVLAAQRDFRDRMEADGVRFFVEESALLMDAARRALGEFVNCEWSDIAPVPNATTGVATAIANTPLKPGDEILTNDHEYPACQNGLRRAAAAAGASVVVASAPFPVTGPTQVVEAIMAKVTPRTRVALISHITSPTGLVLPVEELVRELNARNIDTIIDGAHAPGHIPVDLRAMNPTYYTANCHKWICSPKGSAFLYVRKDRQAGFRPLVLSNNAEKPRAGRAQFLTEFDYQGTADYTAFMSIPAAIEAMPHIASGVPPLSEWGSAPGAAGPQPGASASALHGWDTIRAHNRALVLEGRRILCGALGIDPPAPESMLGALCTLILPPHDPERHARLMQRPTRFHDALWDRLIDHHRIQVPIWGLPGRPHRFVRISAQLYNSREQYEYLAEALREELAAERTV